MGRGEKGTGNGEWGTGNGVKGLEHRVYELFALASVMTVIYNQ